MKKLCSLFTLVLFSCIGLAQNVDVEFELVYTDDGTVEGYPAGFSTWRIYAVLENEADFLSAVYAATGGQPMTITTSTAQVWNSMWGGITGDDINPSLFTDYPAAEYDSWCTIGAADNTTSGAVDYASTQPNGTIIADYFGANGADNIVGDLDMEDGAWFNIIGDADGIAGSDLKVLIAQITTDGDVEICVSFQVFLNGMVGDFVVYDNYCNTAQSPVSVESHSATQMAALSPNPMLVSSILSIDPSMDVDALIIRDLRGKIFKKLNGQLSGDVVITKEDMAAGFYLVQLLSNGKVSQSLKLIVE